MFERLVDELRRVTGLRVNVGWSQSTVIPSITLQMRGCEITPLDLTSSKHLMDMSVQIDLCHASPRARDETSDKVIQFFEETRQRLAEELEAYSIYFEAVIDVDDEKCFRKTMLLRLKMVG